MQEILSYHRVHGSNASRKSGHHRFLSASECREKITAFRAFLTIENIGPENSGVLDKLAGYYSALLSRSFSFPLFIYLIRHSGQFLSLRKRGFLYLKRIKTCYRMSRLY